MILKFWKLFHSYTPNLTRLRTLLHRRHEMKIVLSRAACNEQSNEKRNEMFQYFLSLKFSKILHLFLFLFTWMFFFLFLIPISGKLITHRPHFYNFVILKVMSLKISNIGHVCESKYPRFCRTTKVSTVKWILCVYHCISYIRICQLVTIDFRETFIFASVHSIFHYI